MLIYIDTSIFFNNWYLRSPLFDLLANFINNSGATLVVSEVVCQEVNAKFTTEKISLEKDLGKLVRRAEDFQAEVRPASLPSLADRYDFREVLRGKFYNLRILPFDDVSHADLVSRAIRSRRPFRDGEKGYRDSLIWLSFLGYLKLQTVGADEIAFINGNLSDFFRKDLAGINLHEDLEDDLAARSFTGVVEPFLSLRDFVDRRVDPVLHSVDHEEFSGARGSELEDLAAEHALEYLQNLKLPEAQDFLQLSGSPGRLTRAIRTFSVECFQGLEDPEVVVVSPLSDGSLYLQYRFNMLTMVFRIDVPTEEYLGNKAEFDAEFMNMESNGSVTTMEAYRRVDFDASVIFDPRTKDFISMSIDRADARHV